MRVGETLCDEKLKVVRLYHSLGGFASFDLAVDGDNVTGSARTGRGEIVKLLNIIWRGEYYDNAGEVDGVLEGNRLKLHVQWTDGKIGICTIDIGERGRLSGSVYCPLMRDLKYSLE